MSPKVQILLLAIIAFLHLMPGDTLKCRKCKAGVSLEHCKHSMACETRHGFCVKADVYSDGTFGGIMRFCVKDRSKCDKKLINTRDPTIHFQTMCCNDRDFCNDT